jgi:hypothetical protein
MKSKNNEEVIGDEEAQILINTYADKGKIFDQGNLGNAEICWIKNGLCKVKFEKGKIIYYRNILFKLTA